jgi:hypothetical protein
MKENGKTILMAIAVATVAAAMFMVPSMAEVHPGAGNVAIPYLIPANGTNTSNPAFTEINMNISADYTPLSLYITAQPGILSPMLTTFSVTLRAPGNSSYIVTDSALSGPSDILVQGGFNYSTTLTITAPSGVTSNMTFILTSGLLHHTSDFSYLFQFMTPIYYIGYEHAKLVAPGALTYTEGAEIAIGSIVLALGLFRAFLPYARRHIQRESKKEGLVLLARN